MAIKRGQGKLSLQVFSMSIMGVVFLLAVIWLSSKFLISNQKTVLQRNQEYYQKNADRILLRMVGRNNYIVNIAIQYAEVQREVHSIKYTPQDITEQYRQTASKKQDDDVKHDASSEEESNKQLTGQDKSSYKLYRQAPVSSESADKELNSLNKSAQIEKLPGLIPRGSNGHEEDLPGFPRVSPYSIQAKIRESMDLKNNNKQQLSTNYPDEDINESADTSGEDLKNLQNNKFTKQTSSGTEEKENKYYVKQVLDENKETIIIPDSKIDRMYISLVLNSDKLKELGIAKDEVASVIKSVVGFYPTRGDEMYLVDYPFKGLAYETRKTMSSIISFIKKYRILLMIILGVPLLLFFIIKTIHLVMHLRNSVKNKKVEEQVMSQQKKAEETQTKIDKQHEELIDLAKTKPDDFAQALVDWMLTKGS